MAGPVIRMPLPSRAVWVPGLVVVLVIDATQCSLTLWRLIHRVFPSCSARVRVAIVGSGLAGLSAAVDLVDAGHAVDLYEARPFMGGKVGSWVDDGGSHIEMGLHVFFFNYANLFALMRKVGAMRFAPKTAPISS